jgi:hypothetical protein
VQGIITASAIFSQKRRNDKLPQLIGRLSPPPPKPTEPWKAGIEMSSLTSSLAQTLIPIASVAEPEPEPEPPEPYHFDPRTTGTGTVSLL